MVQLHGIPQHISLMLIAHAPSSYSPLQALSTILRASCTLFSNSSLTPGAPNLPRSPFMILSESLTYIKSRKKGAWGVITIIVPGFSSFISLAALLNESMVFVSRFPSPSDFRNNYRRMGNNISAPVTFPMETNPFPQLFIQFLFCFHSTFILLLFFILLIIPLFHHNIYCKLPSNTLFLLL